MLPYWDPVTWKYKRGYCPGFGHQQGTLYFKGVLDAISSDDFDQRLACIRSKWDTLELSIHPERDPKIYNWLVRNEADFMKSSMIASVRESAGLGSQPSVYTTNRTESINNLAKSYADYHQSSWIHRKLKGLSSEWESIASSQLTSTWLLRQLSGSWCLLTKNKSTWRR